MTKGFCNYFNEEKTKKCSICLVELPLSKFNHDKYSSNGLRSSCKNCDKLSKLKRSKESFDDDWDKLNRLKRKLKAKKKY